MATKNACASDSCPAIPTRIESPIAAMIAAIANSPVCSQKLSNQIGIAASTTTMPAYAAHLDTRQLPRPEQPGWPHQQHEQHHRERRDGAQPAPEERQLLLIARGEHGHDADDQPADHGAAGRV